MPNAQNGWPVILDSAAGRAKLADLVLPGPMPHSVRVLAGDVHTIFRWLVRQYQLRVEPIKAAGCWGWNVRRIGGPDTDWSCHAAACALDINAPQNPDNTPPSEVMTSAQIAECHEIERESDGVLRWGGDWSDPDPMHWEIVGDRVEAAAFARKIRNEEDGMAGITQEAFNERMDAWWVARMAPGAKDNAARTALRVAGWQQEVGRTGESTHNVLFGSMKGVLESTASNLQALSAAFAAFVAREGVEDAETDEALSALRAAVTKVQSTLDEAFPVAPGDGPTV